MSTGKPTLFTSTSIGPSPTGWYATWPPPRRSVNRVSGTTRTTTAWSKQSEGGSEPPRSRGPPPRRMVGLRTPRQGGRCMALFRHRHSAPPAKAQTEDSPFAPEARSRGWEAVDRSVFPSDLTDYMHQSARVLRGGEPRAEGAVGTVDYPTQLHVICRTHVDDRTVIVANGVTNLGRSFGTSDIHDSSVCVVELPSVLWIACIEPRRLHRLMSVPQEIETGDPAFDKQFRVNASPQLGEVTIPPAMRQLIMARDDWIFRTQEFLFACIADDRY